MTRTITRDEVVGMAPFLDTAQPSSWRTLYRTAGVAALFTAAMIPVQIAVFFAYPFPETVRGWFRLLDDAPLAGLVDLDVLLVVDNVLLVMVALALFVALRHVNPSVVVLATGLWLLSIAAYIGSNPAFQMLSLSDGFAGATSEAQRSTLLAAGEAALAGWEGTAFQVAYVTGSIVGIVLGIVMLRSTVFGKTTGHLLLWGNAVGLGLYVPTIGVYISIFSVLFLEIWYLLVGRRLLQLGRAPAASPLA